MKLFRMQDIADAANRSLATVYRASMDKRTFPPVFDQIGSVKFFHPADVKHWITNRLDRRKFNGRKRRR